MRIGMFTWESLYSMRVGGISPHVSELSEALAAEGHEIHLFTLAQKPIYQRKTILCIQKLDFKLSRIVYGYQFFRVHPPHNE